MFSSNYSNDDRYDLKQMILESLVILGLFLMASPLIAFVNVADKTAQEAPHIQSTTSIAKSANWVGSLVRFK